MKLYDISQPLRSSLPTWPGDTAFEAGRTWHIDDACPVNVSVIRMSSHSGTHADAPLHYDAEGADIASVALDAFIGVARVIDARGWGDMILADRLMPHLQDAPPRLLLKTYAHFPHDRWESQFTAIDAEAIESMADHGIVLIGTDAPSLDPQDSKTLAAHHAVRRRGLRILEGLVLDDIAEGDYELIALPLPFAGLDASPVRAVLRDLSR